MTAEPDPGRSRDPAFPDGDAAPSSRSTTFRAWMPSSNSRGPCSLDVFMGKITKWSDKAIAALNLASGCPTRTSLSCTGPTALEPPTFLPITSEGVARMEADGRRGDARSKWPVGVGGKGTNGVAGQVKQQPGSIGYVELIYAIQEARSTTVSCRTCSGRFLKASLEGGDRRRVGRGPRDAPDFRVSITNARGRTSIRSPLSPGSSSTRTRRTRQKGKIITDFMHWMHCRAARSTARISVRAPAQGGRRARRGGDRPVK